jgi:hypothetical protein
MVNKAVTVKRREQALDELMAQERDRFTAAFLRHVEGQCTRIANALTMTPDSARLLESLQIIQGRVY